MEPNKPPNKIEAIYDLREAVENKVHAEKALEVQPSPEKRDALLDAQLTVEEKTQDAIEACMECGSCHSAGTLHRGIVGREGNVLDVNFSEGNEKRSD